MPTQTQASTMQAIEYREAGGPEVIQLTQRPRPKPGAQEVLIKVAAAGVNRPDVMQRKGLYPAPPGASDIPGLEVSGEIVNCGDQVNRFHLGDKVCALIAGGGYSEYVVADETNVLPVPRALTLAEAAAIPETFITVWTNLFQDGHLSANDRVLIHGGSSGIGTTAIMLAKAFHARQIIVTVGSEEKAAACLKLGADFAINYHQQDFVSAIKEITENQGVDLILDIIGGSYVDKNYRAAAMHGRIIQVSAQAGRAQDVELFHLMRKRLIHTGSTLRARSIAEKAAVIADLEKKVWPLVAKGLIKPLIYERFALSDAAKAHVSLESSLHIGKIVLIVNSELATQHGSY